MSSTAMAIITSVCNAFRNSDLRADHSGIVRALDKRFAELEADKARLDWLEEQDVQVFRTSRIGPAVSHAGGMGSLREAIDVAMKEQS